MLCLLWLLMKRTVLLVVVATELSVVVRVAAIVVVLDIIMFPRNTTHIDGFTIENITSVVQNSLGGGGLAGINMSHDSDITVVGEANGSLFLNLGYLVCTASCLGLREGLA